MRITSFIGLALAFTLCEAATAQTLRINEIYASHASTDDMEFIELKGTPLLKLAGYMVLVVEGDSTGAGTLDRAWDLKGFSVPADGYFVLGDTAVSTKDFDIGTSNRIENGTDTFYLIQASDSARAQITALLGKKIVDPNNAAKTTIPGLATITDIIGMVDGGITGTDKTFDGAKNLGPDGNYVPAGVYRTSDLLWCETGWLDFDDVANTNAPSTAGAKNTAHCGKATIASKGKSCLTGVGTTGGPTLKSTIPSIGKSFDTKVAAATPGRDKFDPWCGRLPVRGRRRWADAVPPVLHSREHRVARQSRSVLVRGHDGRAEDPGPLLRQSYRQQVRSPGGDRHDDDPAPDERGSRPDRLLRPGSNPGWPEPRRCGGGVCTAARDSDSPRLAGVNRSRATRSRHTSR